MFETLKSLDMLDYKVFDTGYCTQKESFSIKGGSNKTLKFPASCVLIKHPEFGYILFDTGYAPRFYEAVSRFPYSIYGKITPVFEIYSIKEQLQNFNISPSDIKYIIVSHFHADHIAGLKDFTEAKFLCNKKAYLKIKDKKGFSALKKGFLPDLLPLDFENRVKFIENKKMLNLPPFYEGYDVFGDKTITAVELSGHAEGQIGILFNDLFFVSDACWNFVNYQKNLAPSDFVLNFLGHGKEYKKTLKNLHDFHLNHPKIRIIPAHCKKTLKGEFNV